MGDFGKQGGKAAAPVSEPKKSGAPKTGFSSAPKSTGVNPDKSAGTRNHRRGWQN
jgi:hypothetical protein